MEHVTEMTKADIAKHVQEVAGISEHEAEALLDQILELVKSTLKVGEEVTVTGFGKFRVLEGLQSEALKAIRCLEQF